MRRQRLFLLIFVSCILITLTVLCASASWFVVLRDSNVMENAHTSGDGTATTESPYFNLQYTFTNGKAELTLKDAGKTFFGYDTVAEGFTVEWLDGKFSDGSAFPTSGASTYLGIYAGTHFCRITEIATGQIIYDRLQVKIDKATLTVGALNYSTATVLPAKSEEYRKVSYSYPICGVDGTALLTYKDTVTVPTDAYPANGNAAMAYSYTALSAQFLASKLDLSNAGTSIRNNYNKPADTAAETLTVNLLPTCKTTGGEKLYYGTIDQALAKTQTATTATVVIPMQGFTSGSVYTAVLQGAKQTETATNYIHKITTQKAVIGPNVTLRIPYDQSTTESSITSETALQTELIKDSEGKVIAVSDLAFTSRNKTTISIVKDGTTYSREGLSNEVTVASGVTLTNYGTLEIAGQVSGGNGGSYINSMVYGKHAQLRMESDSHLVCGGVLENGTVEDGNLICYGYITESSEKNTSSVEVIKGTAEVVFTVSEHRGGTIFGNMYNKGGTDTRHFEGSAFNRFWIENISSTFTIHSGAFLSGHADLYAGSRHNVDKVNLVGNTDAYLINLHSGSSLTCKYHHDYDAVTSTNRTMTIEIKGSASFNSLKLSISASGITVSIDTADVLFPLSGYYRITLSPIDESTPATVTLNNDVKLLPGATLTVNRNVTLKGKQLVAYDAMPTGTAAAIGAAAAYQFTTPAKLTVNGALDFVNLGGNIDVSEQGASIKVTGTASMDAKELLEVSGDSLAPFTGNGVTVWPSKTYPLGLKLYQSNGSIGSTYTTGLFAKTYPSVQGSNAVGWFKPYATLTLNANGGSFSDGKSTAVGYAATTFDGGTTQAELDKLPNASYAGHLFVGWGTSATATTPVDPATVKFDTTLYAIWEDGETFTVTFISGKDDITFTSKESGATANYTDLHTHDASAKSVEITYYLKGWSKTQGATTPDATIAIDGPTELYAVWGEKPTYYVKCDSKDALKENSAKYTLTVNAPDGTWKFTHTYTDEDAKLYVTPGYTVTASDIVSPGAAATLEEGTVTMVEGKNREYTVTKNCIAAGTLITLADGTQKKVEDLLESDILLVFDHETGAYVEAPILFIERDGWAEYNVINLVFSDGTQTRLIYEHGLFDLTLNRYVYVTEQNFSDLIGHEFAMQADGGFRTVTLTEAYLTTEYTGCFSLVTVYHFNYFIDGLFSMPGGIAGLFNFFEYDEDLKYDEERMAEDIEKYGLYTYEDFAPYMPEEIFHLFQAPYYKVAVGKGLITFEEIVGLIEHYLGGHGII